MNRYERTAARIQQRWSVHVEWAPANREYVVDGHPYSRARHAERAARDFSRALDEHANDTEWLAEHY